MQRGDPFSDVGVELAIRKTFLRTRRNLSCGNLDLHLSVETQAPLVNPARFMKTALENHSGDTAIPGIAKN